MQLLDVLAERDAESGRRRAERRNARNEPRVVSEFGEACMEIAIGRIDRRIAQSQEYDRLPLVERGGQLRGPRFIGAFADGHVARHGHVYLKNGFFIYLRHGSGGYAQSKAFILFLMRHGYLVALSDEPCRLERQKLRVSGPDAHAV